MKKTIFILLTFSTLLGFSQKTKTFIDPHANWYVADTYINASPEYPSFVETTTRVYGFIGDTLIGTDIWHKLYSTADSIFSTGNFLHGFFREENGLVFYSENFNFIDTIYNFNLQVGDSIYYPLECFENGHYMHVNLIDSIQIGEEYLRRFHFEKAWCPPFYIKDTWIEGIGSINGPLFPKWPREEGVFPDSIRLTCFKSENQLLWQSPFYDECYINHTLPTFVQENQLSRINVFPNPVRDRIYIEFQNNYNRDCVISIFDILGNKIFKERFVQVDIISINTETFLDNFYVLQIKMGKEIYTKKFIKQ